MPNGTAQPPLLTISAHAPTAPPRTAARAPVSRMPPRSADSPYDYSPEPYDRREVIDGTRGAPRADPPPLGPARTGPVTAAIGSVAVSPAATLACPLASVLDQWIDDAVQPAAMKWFGQPVVEIKQISAYSCRGMNGDPNATISEHAFGNALDVAAFTSSRTVTRSRCNMAGTARPRSRAFCTTCRQPPAISSPPCWRPATTHSIIITFTSI